MRIQFPENLIWGAATAAFPDRRCPGCRRQGALDLGSLHGAPGRVQDGTHAGSRLRSLSPLRRGSGSHGDARPGGLSLLDLLAARDERAGSRVNRSRPGFLRSAGRRTARARHPAVRDPVSLGSPWFEEQRGGWESRVRRSGVSPIMPRSSRAVSGIASSTGSPSTSRSRSLPRVMSPATMRRVGAIPLMAFRVAHHLLLAHGAALQRLRGSVPDAHVGPALNLFPVIPRRRADVRLAERIDALANRLFADPILAGRYPTRFGVSCRSSTGPCVRAIWS
jgi:beta-glucosidase